MPEQLPRWCQILDEWLIIAEQELKEVEKGAVPTAQKHKTMHTPHPVKSEVNVLYD